MAMVFFTATGSRLHPAQPGIMSLTEDGGSPFINSDTPPAAENPLTSRVDTTAQPEQFQVNKVVSQLAHNGPLLIGWMPPNQSLTNPVDFVQVLVINPAKSSVQEGLVGRYSTILLSDSIPLCNWEGFSHTSACPHHI
jgi:hypothetical protein